MVFLSATVVQGGCKKCLLSWETYEVHSCNAGNVVVIVLTSTSVSELVMEQ